MCAPGVPTTTGAVYGWNGAPSTDVSMRATPESSSVAVTVTVAPPMYRPCASRLPLTVASTVGGVVSSPSGSTTRNCTEPTGDTLPATSVARYCTEWSPIALTTTGWVYGTKPVSSTSYSTDATPEPVSDADTVTVADPT